MPLFATSRDAKLLKHFWKEKQITFDTIEVDIYKLALSETEVNLYGESAKKVYYNPVRFYCTPTKEQMDTIDVDTNIDVTQTVSFFFLRDLLVDKDYVIEEGDIIKFDEKYYEVDNTRSTNYWGGRNPAALPVIISGQSDRGYDIAIVAVTHLTKLSALNLVEIRSGVDNVRSKSLLPRNL